VRIKQLPKGKRARRLKKRSGLQTRRGTRTSKKSRIRRRQIRSRHPIRCNWKRNSPKTGELKPQPRNVAESQEKRKFTSCSEPSAADRTEASRIRTGLDRNSTEAKPQHSSAPQRGAKQFLVGCSSCRGKSVQPRISRGFFTAPEKSCTPRSS
jgi:hypothetical protein